jgi:uncharacterized protein YbjT (DUF2867 family)
MPDRPDVPILVTGATGNVGSSVVQELQRLDVPFFAAGSNPGRILQVLGDGIETRALDFQRTETYADAVRGIRGLFLLRPPPIGNVKETLNVLIDRAVEAGMACP